MSGDGKHTPIGDPEDAESTGHAEPEREKTIKVMRKPYAQEEEFDDTEGPIRQTTDADARIDLQQYTFRREKGKSWDRGFIPKGMLFIFAANKTMAQAVGARAEEWRSKGKTLPVVFMEEYIDMSMSVEGRWAKLATDFAGMQEERRTSPLEGFA